MKKGMKVLALALGSIVLLLAFFYLSILFFTGGGHGLDQEQFMKAESEYTETAQVYYDDYKTLKTSAAVCYFCPSSDKTVKRLTSDEGMFEMSASQYQAFQTVFDNYNLDDQLLEAIRVSDEFVAFCNINGRESYIYSANGRRPNFVNTPNDKFNFWHILNIEKITDNWYHAVGYNIHL